MKQSEDATHNNGHNEMARGRKPKIVLSENALTVLENRYLLRDEGGRVKETPEEMFLRVAKAVAEPEKDRSKWTDVFYELMTSMRFLPNSPTLMNAGTPLGQLSACFVLPIEDSMEGIFETLKEAAKIHQSGGGTGFSFSRLRPKGDLVKSTMGIASGPVSFMRVYDAATEAVKQGGRRRGANMGVLRVDHPDILEFITSKDKEGDIPNFNISVAATDRFMKAVQDDKEYALINPRTGKASLRLPAREVFSKMVHQAWKNGEPGVIFIDEINRRHPLDPEVGVIESTNPCGEQPLLPYESCNLGSINLSKFFKGPDPWFITEDRPSAWEEAKNLVDWEGLGETVDLAVRFLDDVIDVNSFPLPQIRDATLANRKIGLGVMGFADLLVLLGIPHSSDEAIKAGEALMSFIQERARSASSKLGEEKGSFPNIECSIFRGTPMRNATVTTIAPTGTISMIADCSSGIEPLFSLVYTKTVMDGTPLLYANKYLELAAEAFGFRDAMEELAGTRSLKDMKNLPQHIRDIFQTTFDITPQHHVAIQAAFQRYTCNAVSKTINMPNSATEEDVARVYMLAWQLGCKGITIYRDGSRTTQVLTVKEEKAKGTVLPGRIKPRPRPERVMGYSYKVKTELGNTYITINEDDIGPLEVFVSLGKPGTSLTALAEAIGRLISLALRSSVAPSAIVEQLEGIKSVSPTPQPNGSIVFSVPDAIAKTLKRFLQERSAEGKSSSKETVVLLETGNGSDEAMELCPQCGGPLFMAEGCYVCRDCGYSRCE
ncbi:MAG: vitamin B12-dependent ribonucleotide reductase [candidate division WOR-3 bacterium]